MSNIKRKNREMRHKRVRSRIFGTAEIPRVSVFKSNRHVFAQFIDDTSGKTIVSSDVSVGVPTEASGQSKKKFKMTKTEIASKIGETLAEKAKEAGIKKAVFDRGGFKYHGRIKAIAEGLRKGGIKF